MRRRESLTQDMTPLVDVVFLLLIFFLVATVFKKEELALNLALPNGEAGEKMVDKREITLELSPDALALGGKEITFEALDGVLGSYTDKERPVIVRIDRAVRYERVLKLLDLLQKHNLTNLELVEERR